MSHMQEVTCFQETWSAVPTPDKEKKIIYFSSGETMEEEDSEEEEEQTCNIVPWRDPTGRTRFSLKTVAILVGRISLLICDFLGERLSAALGLNAAKYQYAIDQYHNDNKKRSIQASEGLTQEDGEMIHLSSQPDESRYGATRNNVEQGSHDERHASREDGYHNDGYQADEDALK